MSDTTASLRRRIQSASELQSVVRTMKSLAASSIGQYERSVHALTDYYRTVELGLGVCLRANEPVVPRGGKRKRGSAVVGAVVFGSDQGLVGQFNDIVVASAVKTLAPMPGEALVWAVGQRVHARLAAAGLASTGVFDVPSSVEAIAALVGQILLETEAQHDRARITDLYLVYNRSAPGAVFAPVTERVLPLDRDWRRARASATWPTKTLPEVIGGGEAMLRALVRGFLFVTLYRASAESLASENASRLAAMQRAEKNISESLESLQGAFHRVRQGSIDEELFDVVSGFEALSKGEARGGALRREARRAS